MLRARILILPLLVHVLVTAVLAAASAAWGAGYTMTSGFPWGFPRAPADISPYSELTLTAFAVDPDGIVWTAGNIYAPGVGRDVYALTFSGTVSGVGVLTGSQVLGEPGFGLDEGPPAMVVSTMPAPAYPLRVEAYLAYSSFIPSTLAPSLALSRIRGLGIYAVPAVSTTVYDGFEANPKWAAPAVALNGSATPFTAGSMSVGGTEQLLYLRHLMSYSPVFSEVIEATWSSGSSLSVSARAVVPEGNGEAWVVARAGGDIMLFRYQRTSYTDVTAGDFKSRIDPAYPRRFTTPANDEPLAATRDILGNLWVVGSCDGRAAIWKFSNGVLVTGFPVLPAVGTGSTLWAAAVDENQDLVAVGASDGRVLLTGVDQSGGLMPGMPVIWSAAPDTVEGRGLSLVSGGAVWLGASITASPSSTIWYGSALRILRYDFTPSPPLVPSGSVLIRGPGGQVLDPGKRETISISANASRAGLLKVQVLTLRGEVVREFSADVGAGVHTFSWHGENNAGEELAAGTYAVRVNGAGIDAMKRVVVLRRK